MDDLIVIFMCSLCLSALGYGLDHELERIETDHRVLEKSKT